MSKKGIEYKANLSVSQVAEYLERIKCSLLEGKICLQVADEHVVLDLDLGQALSLEIHGDQKKNRNKISLELSWLTMVPNVESNPGMVISSKEPPAAETEAEAQPESEPAEPASGPDGKPEAPAEPEPDPTEAKQSAPKAKPAAVPKKAPASKTAVKTKSARKTGGKKASS